MFKLFRSNILAFGFFSQPWFWPIMGLALIIAGETAVLAKSDQSFGNGPTFRQYAERIVAVCQNASYRPTCYDDEIPKLMDKITMESAFEVTRIVQDLDPSYAYCHVLGHELSAREVKKNPNDWKDAVARCPSGMCSNGCLHGGFQERFRAEKFEPERIPEVKPDLMTLCEKRGAFNPTGLEQASCYHALGHLTMYITGAEVDLSLDLCDEVALKEGGRDYRQLCYDGVFMQIYQPLEPDDFALIEGKEVDRSEFVSFCNKYRANSKQFGSCYSEGWPLFREDLQKPQGLVNFCDKTVASERSRCYNSIIYVMTSQWGLDPDKIGAYCKGLSGQWSGQCFANAASRMIETDYRNINRAVALCAYGLPYDPEGKCYKEMLLYSTYNFHVGSDEFYEMCNALPESWKGRCLQQDGRK